MIVIKIHITISHELRSECINDLWFDLVFFSYEIYYHNYVIKKCFDIIENSVEI